MAIINATCTHGDSYSQAHGVRPALPTRVSFGCHKENWTRRILYTTMTRMLAVRYSSLHGVVRTTGWVSSKPRRSA